MSILNIFCDASIEKIVATNKYNGVPGCIVLDGDRIIDSDIRYLRNVTNNISEITAVLLGAYKALQYRYMYDTINLFSDSKICIYGLREWIFGWKVKDGVLYGSANTPISNQSIFIEIINLIYANKLNINFYHQKGHVSLSSMTSIIEAGKVFRESNAVNLNIEAIKYISTYNNMIDNSTRNELQNMSKHISLTQPFNFDITKIDLTGYKELINFNGGYLVYI